MPALNLALPSAQATPVAPKAAPASQDKAPQGNEEAGQSQGFAEKLDACVKDGSSARQADGKTASPKDQATTKDEPASPEASAAAAAALAALLGTQAGQAQAQSTQTADSGANQGIQTDPGQGAITGAIAAGKSAEAAVLAAAAAKPAQAQAQPVASEGRSPAQEAVTTSPVQTGPMAPLSPVAATQTQEVTELGAKPKGPQGMESSIADQPAQQNTNVQSFADQLAARTSHVARTEAPQIAVRSQVAQSGWAEEVGNRISWMASKDIGKAELVLTPAHLGRIEVSLSVDGDKASAAFVAATPAAREALEQSLPRLREVMSQAGLNLGQVNVSANNANSQGRQNQQGSSPRPGSSGGSGVSAIGANGASLLRQANGLVDTFA